MNKIKFIITSIALLFCCSAAMAQHRISGHVYNTVDGPVVMANVVELDANNRIVSHAVTDMSGDFSMMVKSEKNYISISYIGYATHKELIGKKTKFNINMRDNTTIQEVVIKAKPMTQSGGLTIPVKEISVAAQTMNMDDVEGLSFSSVDEALQGKIAGLDIVMNSGNLGAGSSMRIRGISSIHGDVEPLIVVDGNIFDIPDDVKHIDFENMDNEEQFATLLSVNPDDIQEIKVLKDAGATAIWGSRGAAGVIEITTRRGVAGKTQINFSYKFSGTWMPSGLNMLDGDGYTMMMKEAYFNPQQSAVTSNMVELNYDKSRPVYYNNFNKNTDWVDAVNKFGQRHNYYVTLSGGGEKARFRISGGYDHETGTIIKQTLDRFSTRIVLDYDVSDRIRFSSNFALTYTDNHRNISDLLGKAYNAMPNMSIYEYDEYGNLTGDFYKMLPSAPTEGETPDGYSSRYLSDMVSNGNPIAIGHLGKSNQSTYRITPQFNIRYKLLGKSNDEHRLDLNADVFLNIYNESDETHNPSALYTSKWSQGVNTTSSHESKSLSFTNRESLVFTPHFNNPDWFVTMMGRYEISSSSNSNQQVGYQGVPTGLDSPIAEGYLTTSTSGSGRSHNMSLTGQIHTSYKERYVFDFTVRSDGSSSFGKGHKWGTFPAISGRWNVTDESWFKPITKVMNMLGIRASWGLSGSRPGQNAQYNRYADYGIYGANGYTITAINPLNLRLTDIRWELVNKYNIGANLSFFDSMLNMDFNWYYHKTSDLANHGYGIPSSTGFSSIDTYNYGELENGGWELYVNTGRFLKKGKFSMKASANVSQNFNKILVMDPLVLSNLNGDFGRQNGEYLKRIQIGNSLGSFYGFRFKGIYRYDYEHNGYTEESKETFGDNTAAAAAARGENSTCPVARDADGNILFDSKGNPLHMYFDYGGTNYEFKGGDAIYEDINHDGQINELDIIYLGNSNPTCFGGFSFDFNYGDWTLKLSFNYRLGQKVGNIARLNNESMRSNINQSQAVAWRWRKNGDITEIPRAMNSSVANGTCYNALGSDRYVESGNFLRLQYIQFSYNFPHKLVKPLGIKSLRFYGSVNQIHCFTKYTGIDPEVGYGSYGISSDNNKTPRSKEFTLTLNVGF